MKFSRLEVVSTEQFNGTILSHLHTWTHKKESSKQLVAELTLCGALRSQCVHRKETWDTRNKESLKTHKSAKQTFAFSQEENLFLSIESLFSLCFGRLFTTWNTLQYNSCGAFVRKKKKQNKTICEARMTPLWNPETQSKANNASELKSENSPSGTKAN